MGWQTKSRLQPPLGVNVNTKILNTKLDYEMAIEEAVEKRGNALKNITNATRAGFTNSEILEQAHIAFDSYYEMQLLKQSMRELFPIPCTCLCDQHRNN
jgi:hypothetical protein